MNVDPVQASSAGIERPTPEKKAQVATPPPSAAPGNTPKTEIAKPQISPVPLLIPEHDVKLQLDTASGTEIYQVLDKESGNLVLQVPSAEQLRGIHQTQELLQRIASRGKVATSDETSTPVLK